MRATRGVSWLGFFLVALATSGCVLVEAGDEVGVGSADGRVEYLSPAGLHHNPAFSQAVVVTGDTKTVYVGGQNAVDPDGNIVGVDDIGAQTEQVVRNLETALAAGGAELHHVVKWTVYVVEGQPPGPGFAVFQRAWGGRPDPPLISVVFVSALAHPQFLVEVEAVAVVPGA